MKDAVACIGTGLIGRAWAITFATGGHEVRLFDEAPASARAARNFAAAMLPELAGAGLLQGQDAGEVLARITLAPSLEAALDGAAHVQESAPERLELKREVFARLDALAAPEAVIASSASAILPSLFTEALAGRQRCMVVHPINPPYLVPAVEVVPAPWTDPAAVARTADLLRGCGMAPIVMKRELDGFVMNRMQGALLEEAFRLVADGYASIEDVDTGIREGLALRWCFMGPFETIDLNAPGGVRDYAERYQPIYERLFASMQRRVDWTGPVMDRIEAERRRRLPAEALAERQKWRDRRLMALIAHKRRAAREIGE
ncbi:MAG: 3-hydroxyacyl-CoA dehydrogenase [Paracoccaceae bacterium]|nr:MAG: 3-hydroxyacyl-CoA dehydrogenase [Paracoccaceae bacterium]